MKRLTRWLFPAAFMMAALLLLMPGKATAQYDDYGGNASYQDFYDALSPYGEWIDDPEYGYVWRPDAGADFQPYSSNGYWAMTDYGNTWVSNYAWGWAPFHYGRWTRSYNGWCWIPGNEWGPAWVTWRSGGGNYGWAPMGPRITVSASFGWNAPMDWWVFIPQAQIYNRGFHSYYRGPRYNNTYISQTTIINNTYINNRRTYVAGPRRHELERAGVRSIPTYRIRDERRPGAASVRRNEIGVYRPSVAANRGRNERPARIVPAERASTGQSGRSSIARGERPGIREQRTQPARMERQERTTAAQPADAARGRTGNFRQQRMEAAPRTDRMEARSRVQAQPDSRVQQPAQQDRSQWNARRDAERQRRMSTAPAPNQRMDARPDVRRQERREMSSTPRMAERRTQTAPSPQRMESRPPRTERMESRPQPRTERGGGDRGFRR